MAIWGIIPAAGIGIRMNTGLPKQYLDLNGQPVLAHTLLRLASVPALDLTVVALHPEDRWFENLSLPLNMRIRRCPGGVDRCHSVLNALIDLQDLANSEDFVLVHDAVRPCVKSDDITRLMQEIADHAAGGLLAVPVSSTLKKADKEQNVTMTLDRSEIWQAATPQIFRYGLLRRALEDAIASGVMVTDESAAVERSGFAPRLVRCSADNIKITYAEDLHLAGLILLAQDTEPVDVEAGEHR